MKLGGRIAVVTGASRGIGRAIAVALAKEGAAVAGCALRGPFDPAGQAGGFLEDLAPDERRRSLFVRCDVRLADDVSRFRDLIAARLGPADLLVNNAGTVTRRPFVELSEQDWDDALADNLRSVFLVSRAFLPAMLERRAGRIINLSSIAGRQGTTQLTSYCAAKHAVVGLTRALAEELRDAGVVVNAICPGSVDTDMLAIGMPGGQPRMTASEVARVALFLAADAPAAMTGSCLDVFG